MPVGASITLELGVGIIPNHLGKSGFLKEIYGNDHPYGNDRSQKMSNRHLKSFKQDNNRGSNIHRSAFTHTHTHTDGLQSRKWIEMKWQGARIHIGKTSYRLE